MAVIFKNMINDGNLTIDQVPKKWRVAVQKLLDAEAAANAA